MRTPRLLLALAALLLSQASSIQAYSILFYYSSNDAYSQRLLMLRNVLVAAGHTVTTVDVGSSLGCPSELWDSYEQVWDARYLNTPLGCPAPSTNYDYFSACWQSKAQAYLQNCGKFFLLGENAGFASRADGNGAFLKAIGAVSASYVTCGYNVNGSGVGPVGGVNSAYPSTLPGTTQLWGEYAGGVPLSLLNGTSYVTAPSTYWTVNDGVSRSIAAGWTGSQMSNLTVSACARGRLFSEWDMSMFLGSNYAGTTKTATDLYFTQVAAWLGNASCSCPSATPTPSPSLTPTPRMPLVKTVNVSQATLGDTLTFCIQWTNDSSATQTLNIWDSLSAALGYLGCSDACSASGQLLRWTFSAPAGAAGQVCAWAVITGYP